MSLNVINRTKKTKVVVAGGGFVGLTAARYFDQGLARRGDIEVVLISRENFMLFTPMLHEVAAGDLYPGDIVNPFRRVLQRCVNSGVDTDLGGRRKTEFGYRFLTSAKRNMAVCW